MSNILDYIKKYSKLSFDELSYNECDEIIFSMISYVNFDGILDHERYKKIKLSEVAKEFFSKYTKKEINKNILGVQTAIKTLDAIKDSKRYKDLDLYNYSYKCDSTKQFSALFIDIDQDKTFISYEGTDDLISGWKEDAAMSYEFPVPAQREAIKYINRKIPIFSKRKYIIGGHSKGGNLALVSAMYANPLIRKKIIKVINFDGPGLKKKQIESRHFKRILPIYQFVIPNYSVVGLLLRHVDNYRVILSNKKGINAHNIIFWQIMDTKLVDANLSSYSKKVDKIITDWLDKYNDNQRKQFVYELFEIFNRCNIDSLLDIKESTLPSIINILKESKKLNTETKDMLQT